MGELGDQYLWDQENQGNDDHGDDIEQSKGDSVGTGALDRACRVANASDGDLAELIDRQDGSVYESSRC